MAVSVAGISAADPAMAQRNEEERCTLSGRIERYSAALETWMPYGGSCNPNTQSGRRTNEDDRSDRSSNASSGSPEDGDQKCGPDGYVMVYRKYTYLKSGWSGTGRRCSR